MYRGQEMIEEELDEKKKGFDLTVTHRHPKTGLVIKEDPYVLRVISNGEGKAMVYERPKGSGNLWDKQGNPIGRWDVTKAEGERFQKDAAHVSWTPPESQDQKLARQSAEKDVRIAELEKELAAIRSEKDKKTAPAKKD